MKTSLYTLAHNIRNAIQIAKEAYLRRAMRHRQGHPVMPHQRSLGFRHFGSGRGYLKYWR